MDELATLLLQIEWGADEALAEQPQDRVRPQTRIVRAPAVPAPAAPAPAAPAPAAPAPAARAAPAAPAGRPLEDCATIDELRAALEAFDGCALRDTASRLVFAEGDPHARVLLVADPPSADDDRAGRPLAGADGAYLERMLASIGLARAEILLTPVIPWRPPGGRPPSPVEIAQCLPFLHRLVAVARPRVLVLAGTLACKTLFGATRPRTRDWGEVGVPGLDQPLQAAILPSPALLMRSPGKRSEAWATLRRLRRALDKQLTQT